MSLKKYKIDTEENRQFLAEIRKNLLDFGKRFPSPAGSSYYLGEDGTPWTDRNRETWITGRMVHVYSIAEMLGEEGTAELALAGIRGLMGELKDSENGGFYAGVTAQGEPLETKQCYAHAFVILAASSAVLAGIPEAKELLGEAISVFDRYFWQEETGLTMDTWDTGFTKPEPYRGLNANMHTVEAFLAAADALGEEIYRERAEEIIHHVINWASKNEWRIPEHFSENWEPLYDFNKERQDDPFKPYGATPGHGIEWARLITQWAVSVGRFSEYSRVAQCLYERAVMDAWNADGAPGLVYTTNWQGTPVVHDRMHWTLAEAINTAAVLYRATGEERYAADYEQFMRYLDEKVLDHENGSWFHQMDRSNRVIGTVWPGKSDLYHAFQATLIPYNNPAQSIAFAVYLKKRETAEKTD